MTDHQPLDPALLAAIAARVGESRFDRWLGQGVHLGLSGEGDSLRVRVPNSFYRQWIDSHLSGSLVETVESVTGRRVRLTYAIDDGYEPAPTTDSSSSPAERHPDGTKYAGNTPGASERGIPRASSSDVGRALRPAALGKGAVEQPRTRIIRTIDELIAGPGNRLAIAAASEMVRTRGALFNPLFIQGGVGLGKTTLLEATAHGLRVGQPGLQILCVTAEAFTNSFLESMRAGTLSAFRSRHRSAGALAVDDVHFLAGTRATQNEFLHTFSALLKRGAPIILTADQHPRQITRLTEELVTRFLGGMVVKLDPPDRSTRLAILQQAAELRKVSVPVAVLDYIAENLRSSIRELEGALNTVIGHATLTGERLDLSLARSALRDTVRHVAAAVGLAEVERAVCQLFQIDKEVLKSDTRIRSVSHPRMLAMYLARKHTGCSYGEIGNYFGGRNYSTVMSAEKKVLRWLSDEEKYGLLPGFDTVADLLDDLEARICK